MSIKNLFQQESDSVTEQPVRIPFDFSNRDSIPNGKDPGNSIVIKPITVRTWFRIRPLLLDQVIRQNGLNKLLQTIPHGKIYAYYSMQLYIE